MSKPLTAEKILQDFAKDYTECKTADEINKTVKGYASTLNAWQDEAVVKELRFVKERHPVESGMHGGCTLCWWIDERIAHLQAGRDAGRK